MRGHLKGRAQGRREGRAAGKAEGIDFRNRELAKGFREDGFPLEAISRRTGLTVDEILAL
ncbi:MAG: hypothetical protein HUK20_12865 [Fibrobacter sp.]|nr:hypothetical protein [Fibrobacter sp.]